MEYSAFDGLRKWEVLYEDFFLVLLDTGVKRGNDCNLVGIHATDMRVKWSLSGILESRDGYDGIVNVWISGGAVWTGTWSGFQRRIDYRTGEVLEEVFAK
jgi:hypothetical protein